jgi:serine-type D-Ala-D-Ala carboxypeptidase (penicillin-binding protein 5/6)
MEVTRPVTPPAPLATASGTSARRRIGAAVLAVALASTALATPAVAVPASALAPTVTPDPPGSDRVSAVVADAYALVDVTTGRVLASRELHSQRLVASTVKIMTALTAVRFIDPDEPIVVSARAAAKPAMRIGMQEGQRWRRDDALASMLMVSANDASYALAETASGSVEAFAEAMQETGELLGLRDSTFADPAGFDDSFNAEIGASKMSVYDLGIASRALLADPTLARIVSTPFYEFPGPARDHDLTNHSKMLRQNTGRYYEGTDGIKTGYTKRARGTFVASATRGGRTLIAVVLGNVDIYTPAQQLLDFGFSLPSSDPGIGVTLPPVASLDPAPPAAAPVDAASGDTTGTTVAGAAADAASGGPSGAVQNGAAGDTASGGSGLGHRVLDAMLVLALAALALFGLRLLMGRSGTATAAADAAADAADDDTTTNAVTGRILLPRATPRLRASPRAAVRPLRLPVRPPADASAGTPVRISR